MRKTNQNYFIVDLYTDLNEEKFIYKYIYIILQQKWNGVIKQIDGKNLIINAISVQLFLLIIPNFFIIQQINSVKMIKYSTIQGSIKILIINGGLI